MIPGDQDQPPVSQLNKTLTRVILCTYPGIFADAVIKELQEKQFIELAGLVYSNRIFSASETWAGSAWRLIKTSGINYAILQFLQTDGYRLLKRILLSKPIEKNVPVWHTKNINNESGLAFIKELNPDVILLANFNQKVSQAVINTPGLACLNIHPALLPDFKGVDPVFAALYSARPSLGVTVHLVDENFDTGAILIQDQMTAEQGSSVFYHQFQLFRLGGKLAAQVIKQLREGALQVTKNTGGHYDSWPTKNQIRQYKLRGGQLITLKEYWLAVIALILFKK